MKDIRLIAMDLDGTALLADHRAVSDRLLLALEEAFDRGIAIVPVTGRQFRLLPPFLKAPRWASLAVLCNGAEVRRLATGELLSSFYMSPAQLLPVLDLAREYRLPLEFLKDGFLYLTEEDLESERKRSNLPFHQQILAEYGRIIPDRRAFCLANQGFEKLNLPCVPEGCREAVHLRLKELGLSAVPCGPWSIEITHPDATKGAGLQRACDLLGISMTQVLALGDSGNDVSMLRDAGWGVAMGNAPEEIRRIAKAVTASNTQDGAAIAIERYALGK